MAIVLCLSAGIIGSVATYPAIDGWYKDLIKPFFAPPNFLFGPVWTTLYMLMGISLYLVWDGKFPKSKIKIKREGLNVFYAQLILNTLWSVVFFGLKSPEGAFVIILLLWVLIAASIYIFNKLNRIAAYLLVPYILWVSFASLLNLVIAYLN